MRRPYHPQPQGKIEQWHQILKKRILLDNYSLGGDLEQQINAFAEHYNHVRYHVSIDSLIRLTFASAGLRRCSQSVSAPRRL